MDFFSILFIVLISVTVIVVIAVACFYFFVKRKIRKFFGFESQGKNEETNSDTNWNSKRNHDKIFPKDEGEYIDFEEVKDE